jgi:hypothetical protein
MEDMADLVEASLVGDAGSGRSGGGGGRWPSTQMGCQFRRRSPSTHGRVSLRFSRYSLTLGKLCYLIVGPGQVLLLLFFSIINILQGCRD